MTRPNARSARNVFRWLGLGGQEPLATQLAVLSPHLDDAVFSLGAAIAAATSLANVSIVTVLAGDPAAREPAGPWDAAAGFRTAGEAAASRRREDELACADVGARPVWLTFLDHQYERAHDDDAVWAAIEVAVAGADAVLVPAFPLIHEDHRWLSALVRDRGFPGRRVGLYVEQPYTAAWSGERPGNDWQPLGAALPHRLTKIRACRRYASQLPLLERQRRIIWPLVRYEAAQGGECVCWI